MPKISFKKVKGRVLATYIEEIADRDLAFHRNPDDLRDRFMRSFRDEVEKRGYEIAGQPVVEAQQDFIMRSHLVAVRAWVKDAHEND